jgi:integrase
VVPVVPKLSRRYRLASVQKHRTRWRVKWRDETGRALYDSYPTKLAAEQAARMIEARTVLDGRPPVVTSPDALTLASWWSRWEPGRPWRTSTRATHAVHWRKWIKPVFGRVPIENITSADVARFHRRLEAVGLAPATVAAVHRTLSMCLQGALQDELLARNPARHARLRRTPQAPPVALDVTTTTAMLDAIAETAPGLALYARLIAATGLRRGEAAGLTWDRLDLDAGVLTVDRQLDWTAPEQPAWGPTKTSGTRRVLLTASIVEALMAHRKAQPVAMLDGTGLVFTRPSGAQWPRETLTGAWRRAATKLDAAGTPLPAGARGWHTLRHTVASRLLEAGVPVAEAAAMLGHSPEMLLATYAHVTDRAAADARLREALSP